ncbi:SIR2 family NAD-dependent protein deacylase [Patiriisocius hiemis]|uniref:NAD-dependent protein deacylase n=1 Tax=Patiriisocius hiemis TaxID=3075604 RepID=A0ABU2Y967_9FLAO|nr:NAD-dependent deacylase [Constantimarinum sp. W242]MDT0554722.1 NAD-dependent deacylase [Constantimarinum sp. W242]
MKIVVLSGAGISAESGLKTFRDSNGLWEGHDVMEVATPQGFANNPELVLEFYNQRRRQLLEVKPNAAHIALADIEKHYEVTIITQNVDDLHERAGSTNVVHLHGELLKVRSTFDENLVMDWRNDLVLGDFCEHNSQLRPHIVWFGEAVPMLDVAIQYVEEADIIVIVGTSMQVYPAASLIQYASPSAKAYFVDPNPSIASSKQIKVIAEKATIGVPRVIQEILKDE